MKNKFNIILAAAIGLVLLSSCASNKLLYTEIDVLRPADVAFAEDVNSLLMVNNSVTQPKNVGHTTELLDENLRIEVVNTDSLSIFLLNALNEELSSKGFFAYNNLIYNSVNTSSDFESNKALTETQVNSFTNRGYDVVLSLNKLETTDDLVEHYNSFFDTYTLSLDVVYKTWWTIQYPNAPEKTKVLTFKDTVYWEASSEYRRQLFDNFPNRIDALVDGSLYVGQKMINRIIPYWEENDRFLFEIKDPLVTQGMDSVYKRNWAGAAQIWENALAQSTSKKNKSLIMYNIAVANEITGNLEKALNYTTQAIDLYSSNIFSGRKNVELMLNYKESLLTRRKQAILLREQIGE